MTAHYEYNSLPPCGEGKGGGQTRLRLNMSLQYHSPSKAFNAADATALAAVHEIIEDAYASGTVGKTTMREFDQLCLTEVRLLSPADIKSLADTRTRQPDRLCARAERNAGVGESVGAGRKEARQRSAQAADAGREEGMMAVA